MNDKHAVINEPILKLIKDAGFVLWGDEEWNPGDVVDWSSSYDLELAKFAQLILQQVADQINDLIVPETIEQDIGPYDYWNRALGTLAINLEQHFGIE